MEKLEVLDVSNNSLSGEVPEELSRLKGLVRVSLIGNRLKVGAGGEVEKLKKKLGEERLWV